MKFSHAVNNKAYFLTIYTCQTYGHMTLNFQNKYVYILFDIQDFD